MTVAAPDGPASARGLGSWLVRAAPAGTRGEVTIALVSDARMRTLNRSFRGKDYATDVLAFPVSPTQAKQAPPFPPKATSQAETRGHSHAGAWPSARSALYLGDVVIATGVARRQADDVGHPFATELRVLALHGLLHLLGYDHEHDSGEMRDVEARLRRKAGLKQGLIARGAR